eukprot:Opistho-2@27456
MSSLSDNQRRLDIAPATVNDEADWRRMWCEYYALSGRTITQDTTDDVWSRIVDQSSPTKAYVAIFEGRAAGFCNLVVHESTWSRRPYRRCAHSPLGGIG